MKFWQRYAREILIIVGVILLMIVMMDYNARLEKLNELNEKVLTVRAEATMVMQTQVVLRTAIAEATSETVTEREARNNGEIQEGDQLIVPLPVAGEPLLDASTPYRPPQAVQKWQVWAELFFGE